jgi:hypothetical protein
MRSLETARADVETADVATRSAAIREIAARGDWTDATTLLRLATSDKSHAVRLYAAAALCRIASRSPRDRDRDETLLRWVAEADPERNPSLVSLLAFVDDDRALDRIGRLLRDPRNGVRAGALVALRRVALGPDERAVGPRVSEWLAQPKLPPDVGYELVRLVGEVGLDACAPQLARAASFGPKHIDAATEAIRQLDARRSGAGWLGAWRRDGTRLLDDEGPDDDVSWLIVGPGAASMNGAPAPWTPGAPPRLGAAEVRLVYGPPPGQPEARVAVLQIAGDTFWKADGKTLGKALDDDPEAFAALPDDVPDPFDEESAATPRHRALWDWRTGRLDAARDALVELVDKGRAPGATPLWLARVYEDLGERAAARAAASTFLDKAKRGPERDRAAALLARLGA